MTFILMTSAHENSLGANRVEAKRHLGLGAIVGAYTGLKFRCAAAYRRVYIEEKLIWQNLNKSSWNDIAVKSSLM